MATITGTSGNDSLTGDSQQDVIYGGDGNDSIDAGGGQDEVHGGAGDDRIEGGAGQDVIYGGDGNDTLYGGVLRDTLVGDAGDDTLFGGFEAVGQGDVFVVEWQFGNDVIADFQFEREQIAVRSGGVSTFADIQARMAQAGPHTVISFDDGSTLTIQNTLASVLTADNFVIGSPVCYAEGTLVLTPRGEVPVEALAPGDLLVTADNGPQPVRWIGASRHEFAPGPHRHKPIEIKPGALGLGPRRRLVVSPQHRVAMRGPLVERLFGAREVLALARGLTGLPGVRAMNGKRAVTYYSLLCDRHEVVMAEGAWSESFYPGPTALEMIGPALRAEVEALFPRLATEPAADAYGPTARRVLSRAETRALVRAMQAPGSTDAGAATAREETPAGAGAARRVARDTEFARWDEDKLRDSEDAAAARADDARRPAHDEAAAPRRRLRLVG